MPLYDHECQECKKIFEAFAGLEEQEVDCSCGAKAHRIISVSGQYLGNVDTPWIRSVLDVVDRENPAKHVQEFVRNPNRRTYQAWMKGEGIRPMDHTERGAPPTASRRGQQDMRPMVDYLFRRHRERRAVEVR